MFDYSSKYSVAAALILEGCRIIPLPSQRADSPPDFLFCFANWTGCPALATSDIDFAIRMQQLPRLLASLIEKYVSAN